MASSSHKVSLEALAENEIQEIAYDGTEKTVMYVAKYNLVIVQTYAGALRTNDILSCNNLNFLKEE